MCTCPPPHCSHITLLSPDPYYCILLTSPRLFERGADSVGLDFLAHPFWDRYIEFEERAGDQPDRIFEILSRIIHIPLHQYARYFERYQQIAGAQPVEKLVPDAVLQRLSAATTQELSARGGNELDHDRELRGKISNVHMDIFNGTQAETTKRWTYEQEVKRPYFHVTELEEGQLSNWSRYLDFEEQQGDYSRTKFLYERCVVACAHYEEYWQRYARWMYAQEGKEDEVRNILRRACCLYAPIARPAVRMQWALFEETCDRSSVAAAIYEAILVVMPGYLEAITSLASMQRRQAGSEAAMAVYQEYLDNDECTSQTKGALVAEMAQLACQMSGSMESGRKVFQAQQQDFVDSQPFWSRYLTFEMDQSTSPDTVASQLARVKAVHEDLRRNSRLSHDDIRELSQVYLRFLSEKGGPSAAREYMDLDAEVNGPASIVPSMKNRNMGGKSVQQAPMSKLPMSNGHVVG